MKGRARRCAVSVVCVMALVGVVSACTASTGPSGSGSTGSGSAGVPSVGATTDAGGAKPSTTLSSTATTSRSDPTRPGTSVRRRPGLSVPSTRAEGPSPRAVVEAGTAVDVSQFAWMGWGAGAELEESDDAVAFTTPTGRIACMLGYGQVTCSVGSASFPGVARPAACDPNMDWMTDHVRLDASGPSHGVCGGGVEVPPEANTMDYGMTIAFDGYACAVTEAGVTCLDGADRGFFVSATEYRALR